MAKEFQQIFPNIPTAADVFTYHELGQEFRREVEYRDNFAEYCQWYRLTSQQHQQELREMKRDINIFRWFLRR